MTPRRGLAALAVVAVLATGVLAWPVTGRTLAGRAGLLPSSDRAVAAEARVRPALEADLASKQLASAMASLESARNEAQRQQVYLERIAQPSLPDVAQEPRRMRSILSTFLLGLMAWGILSMLVAGVREHQD